MRRRLAAQVTSMLRALVRDGITRTLGVIGLGGIALIHLLDAPSTFSSTRYIGWLYVAAIVASMILAAGLIRAGDRRTWLGAAVLPASVMAGYVLSRTTGLPSD